MRKTLLFPLALLLFALAGCGHAKTNKQNTTATVSAKAVTKKAIGGQSKTWQFDQEVTSQQTQTNGLSDQLSLSTVKKANALTEWTTTNGEFTRFSSKYPQISYKAWQKEQRQHVVKSYQKTMHYITVAQANATLKKLGATIQIKKITDLIFLKPASGSLTVDEAFVAKGHHLYGITVEYRDSTTTTPTTVTRGTAYTDRSSGKSVDHVAPSKLNGTWVAANTTTSANDSGKILIKNGYLYQHRYDSYERSAVQDLSKYARASLNQNITYAAQKRDAAHAGYDLGTSAVASGDSVGYLYLFLTDSRMIRIAQGQVTTYDKTSNLIAATDLPVADLQIFSQMDKLNPGDATSTITVKADAPMVGMSTSIDYLTNSEAGQISKNQAISMQNGQVVVKK
ncbi:hypothetical protein [Lactiplantibacillus carotarum]|uniref:hypothetical protein n=1 Tax=Lactiplantibacillus carotarum TaxID=2993456 RepID=UPI00298EFB22|nr:hypothetical protein [Lactiplantibacillus carotarum]